MRRDRVALIAVVASVGVIGLLFVAPTPASGEHAHKQARRPLPHVVVVPQNIPDPLDVAYAEVQRVVDYVVAEYLGVVDYVTWVVEQARIEAERQAEQARIAAYIASLPKPPPPAPRPAAPAPAPPPSGGGAIPTDFARWERLHNCEQPGNWYANGTNPGGGGQVFQGGLGMSTTAWQMAVRAAAARGVALPSSALAASPEQQMVGAQAFYDAYGWGWSCHV